MIVAINYANDPYKKTQKYCTHSAYKYGVDKVFEYGPKDIDFDFYKKNKSILDQKRGNGYWLWKPYIISETLKKIDYGDFLLYIDAGSYFIGNVNNLLKCMENNGDDIISFELPFIERQWTKKEIFNYFKCDQDKSIIDTCQRIATFIILKKTRKTVEFIEKYLKVAQVDHLITDELNNEIQDRNFIENRHDQSIFSVLAKIENVPVYKDPSEYGVQPQLLSGSYPKAIFKEVCYEHGNYSQILVLHRKKKVTAYVRLMSFVRSKFSWKLYRKLLKYQKVVLEILKGKK